MLHLMAIMTLPKNNCSKKSVRQPYANLLIEIYEGEHVNSLLQISLQQSYPFEHPSKDIGPNENMPIQLFVHSQVHEIPNIQEDKPYDSNDDSDLPLPFV
ncbi:hypothetical protein HanIR_Chr10g0477811 [Helianthus annuus]|nr:hypothetical protein HanIR_Chr10g0477811 [Helianthus annuus]